jgi:thiamine-phosphate pyrophosphorylase
MLRCAITDGTSTCSVNAAQIDRLQNQVRRWAANGIDFIQLREKRLDAGALFTLAEHAMQTLREMDSATKLLINTRADVAIAARAHGVHLTSHVDELTPQQARALYAHAGLPSPAVSVSCHTKDDVTRARDNGADLILFGPVFEKQVNGHHVADGSGIDRLRVACELAQGVPVLALGGVTPVNAPACVSAGAAGIAGIRTFV